MLKNNWPIILHPTNTFRTDAYLPWPQINPNRSQWLISAAFTYYSSPLYHISHHSNFKFKWCTQMIWFAAIKPHRTSTRQDTNTISWFWIRHEWGESELLYYISHHFNFQIKIMLSGLGHHPSSHRHNIRLLLSSRERATVFFAVFSLKFFLITNHISHFQLKCCFHLI